MKRRSFVALVVLATALAVLPVSRAAAQSGQGIPQQLQAIRDTLDSMQSEITEIKNRLNAGVEVTPTKYYVTKEPAYTGAQALTACAPGFHMANLYEVLDPSTLQYDTTLGLTREDSGLGPPSYIGAWMRTGQDKRDTPGESGGRDITGYANCNAYTSDDPLHVGAWVRLSRSWNSTPTAPAVDRVAPWIIALDISCDSLERVWCVEDP